MIINYKGIVPKVKGAAFVAENSTLVGDVTLGQDASIWYGAVLRADCEKIVVGTETNIQDNAVIHTDINHPCIIGSRVTVGHAAILHSCMVEDHCLIGMGAIVLNGAVIGKNSIVGAGALVTKNTVIPEGSLVIGAPAKVKRQLTEDEIATISHAADEYVELSRTLSGEPVSPTDQ